MAVKPIDTLKSWFVTFAKPTQAQFWDWLDSFRHRSEKITTNDIDQAFLDLITSLPTQAAIDALLASLNGKADLDGTGHLVESQWPVILTADTLTLSANGAYLVPANRFVDTIIVTTTASVQFSIGSATGGQDIQPPLPYAAGVTEVIQVAVYANGAARNIYFTGIDSETTFKIYKR